MAEETHNRQLNAEQLAFYTEKEAACRKAMKVFKICMITTTVVAVVVMLVIYVFMFLIDFHIRRSGGEGAFPKGIPLFPLYVGCGMILAQLVLTAPFAFLCEKKLEKLQRERLFGEK